MHRADDKSTLPHAVSRLRTERMARSAKPFLARGGIKGQRCPGCRLVPSHCMCLWRPQVSTSVGMCLLMSDIEPLKPSNTGWLIADVIRDTFAFGWSRTEVDSGLMALLTDFQWEAYLVFPDEFVSPERVVYEVEAVSPGKRPLFNSPNLRRMSINMRSIPLAARWAEMISEGSLATGLIRAVSSTTDDECDHLRENSQKYHQHNVDHDERHDTAENRMKGNIGAHAVDDKTTQTERRREQANAAEFNDDHPEPNRVVTKAGDQWEDDRQRQQHDAQGINEHSKHEKQCVHHKQHCQRGYIH